MTSKVWKTRFAGEAQKLYPRLLKDPEKALLLGIGLLNRYIPSKPHRHSLLGQPFDCHLLALSTLFRRSRDLFLKTDGFFEPAFISSARTLSSAGLLQPRIEYSPIENELIWAATNPIQKKTPEYLLTLRTYSTSLFHEQNHRILWKMLPGIPLLEIPADNGIKVSKLNEQMTDITRRYLNFVESLVVTADMALGDQLDRPLAYLFHILGVTYDPGTTVKKDFSFKGRMYRNYLHAALYATYLNLEMYSKVDIQKIIRNLYLNIDELIEPATARSLRLDRQFVERTNPIWQNKHKQTVIDNLGQPQTNADTHAFYSDTLMISDDPLDNRVIYLWTEKWFNLLGI